MKKLLSLVLSILLILSVAVAAPVSAGALISGDFIYKVLKSGNAEILGLRGSNNVNLTIPAKLDGHKVTSIGAGAFDTNDIHEHFNKVVISKGITNIGNSAFEGRCIQSVKLPSTLKKIGAFAFMENNFESITIPKKTTTLGNGAFESCRNLKKVTIKSKLKKIVYRCFTDCSKLTTIKLPSTVKTIGDDAFSGCKKLKTIKFPSALKSIGGAFSGCKKLNNIKFTAKITKIGDGAFAGCTGLSKVKFSEGLKTIGKRAFSRCHALNEVSLPYSLKTIGEDAFLFCLTKAKVMSGVTKIGDHAFGYYSEIFGDYDLMYCKEDNNFTMITYKNCAASKYADNNGFSKKILQAPKKVKLNKKKAVLKKGKTLKLKATLTSKKSTTLLTWKSSNKKIATVSSKGKIKAKKVGTATITVKTHNGKKAKCKIKVTR